MLKVLIADDHPMIREGIKRVISQTRDMVVVAEASDGQEVLQKVARQNPEVVILDISMPGRSGLDVLKQLHTQYPKLPILILSQYPESQYASRVMHAGAFGYLTKETAIDQVVEAIRKAAAGKKYITDALADILTAETPGTAQRPLHETLSDREYEILLYLGEGKTVTDIARDISLSVKTISTYRTRILDKMKMSKTAELIRYVIYHRLVEAAEVIPSSAPVKTIAKTRNGQ
jgi:two-component system invasion response regulator UvrY